MRSLGLDEAKYLPQQTPEEGAKQHLQEGQEEYEEDPAVESPLPPPIPGVKEHYLIVDIGADGRSVVAAHSLSPAWQIIDTDVRTAPSFDENSPDQGYMLRIKGVGLTSNNKAKGKVQAGQDRLSEATEKSQGDILGALDRLMHGIQEGLGLAAKISESRRLVETETRTVEVPND